MSFDLERAKKEGCIMVSGDGESPARIICDDRKSEDGWNVVALCPCEEMLEEMILTFQKDGSFTPGCYLKNKPKKLEVRIYKETNTGEIYAATSYQNWASRSEPGYWEHLKTIEVEI